MERDHSEKERILSVIVGFLCAMLIMTFVCLKLEFLYTPQVYCVQPEAREIEGVFYPTVLPAACLSDGEFGTVVYVPEKTSSPFAPMIVRAVRVEIQTKSGGYAAVSGRLTNDADVVLYASVPLSNELSVRPEDQS